MLILRALSLGPNHGLGIARRIGQVTGGELDVRLGSLFPALYRLEERGWLTSMPSEDGAHPRVKLYKLTHAGRKQITTETESNVQPGATVNVKATSFEKVACGQIAVA